MLIELKCRLASKKSMYGLIINLLHFDATTEIPHRVEGTFGQVVVCQNGAKGGLIEGSRG